MYGDPKKPCCYKNCNVKADLVENKVEITSINVIMF